MRLCFATNNLHKLNEIRLMLGKELQHCKPEELGISTELPENQDTLEGNSLEKAQYVYNRGASTVSLTTQDWK